MRQLASDTWSGLCPEALAALQAANVEHAGAYGDDDWTRKAQRLLRDFFEKDCAVFFVPTGTAANALALAALCQPHHSILCHADAHIQTDECGAPEFFAHGVKLTPLAGEHGKLEPGVLVDQIPTSPNVHGHVPRVLSLSQATEVGTVYEPAELATLCAAAHRAGLHVHVDGARFANAVVTLGATPREISWEAGVDVLCLGGTKTGVALCDAVVFFDRELARGFEYRRKQAGMLFSKMRFLAAPWAAALEEGVWLRSASHANEMARLLANKLRGVPGIRIVHPVQANGVFVDMPTPMIETLHGRGWHFYPIARCQRLMCSWDTQPEDVERFAADCRL